MDQGPLRKYGIRFTEKLEKKIISPLKCKGEKVKMVLTIGFDCESKTKTKAPALLMFLILYLYLGCASIF